VAAVVRPALFRSLISACRVRAPREWNVLLRIVDSEARKLSEDSETLRMPHLMSKRTIRLPDVGGWRRRWDLGFASATLQATVSRSLTPTDLAKMPNSRLSVCDYEP